MADWSANVGITQLYTTLLSLLAARDVDAVTLGKAAYTNPPDGAIAWVRASNKFREWNNGGGVYVDMVIDIAGGGTGASTAATARTSLGLGTIATQDANAVAISGGAVAASLVGSTNVPAGALTGGPIAQARLGTGSAGAGAKFLADDQTYKTIATLYENITATIAAVQAADFTADFTVSTWPLSGSHVCTLPTVIGNGGKRLAFINTDGGRWTFNTNGAETLFGKTNFKFSWGKYSSFVIEANATSGLWEVVASYPKGKLLLYENSGSDASAGVTTFDSFAISNLDDGDTLVIELSVTNTGTGAVSVVTLNNTTDAVAVLAQTLNLNAGDSAIWEYKVKRCQDSNKHIMATFFGRPTTSGTAALDTIGQQSTWLTAFTGAFTLGLAHGGIVAGGNIKWFIRVYKD